MPSHEILGWTAEAPPSFAVDRLKTRVQKKPGFLKKSPTQWVFWGFWVLLGFLDKQEKIGKIIQKLSNLKP